MLTSPTDPPPQPAARVWKPPERSEGGRRDPERSEGVSHPIPREIHFLWLQGEDHMRTTRPHVAAMVEHTRRRAAENPNGWAVKVWTEREVLNECWQELDPALSDPLIALLAVCPSHAARSDVLRMIVLWARGGLYLDADLMLLTSEFDWVLGSASDARAPTLALTHTPNMAKVDRMLFGSGSNNCFIAAAPRHPFIGSLLRKMASAPAFVCEPEGGETQVQRAGLFGIGSPPQDRFGSPAAALARMRARKETPKFPCTTWAAREWTIYFTGPGLLGREIGDPRWAEQVRSGEFRLIPTTTVLMVNKGVDFERHRTPAGEVDTASLEEELLSAHPSAIAAHVSDNSWVSDGMVAAKVAALAVREAAFQYWWVLLVLLILSVVVIGVGGGLLLRKLTRSNTSLLASLRRRIAKAAHRERRGRKQSRARK